MSAVDESTGGSDRSRFVNKRELAKRVLGCALPTVADMLDRWPDFPIVQRGDMSREWLFDPVEVVAFITRKRGEEAEASAKREDLFGQIKLPLDEPEAEMFPSPTARLAHLKAMRLSDELRKARGELVDVADVMAASKFEWKALGDWLRRLPLELGRECNLPEAIVLRLRQRIEQGQREFVAALKKNLLLASKGQSRRFDDEGNDREDGSP